MGTINKMYILWHLKQNDIIILHDRKWTPDMLEGLLKEIISRGHFVTNLIDHRHKCYDSDSD